MECAETRVLAAINIQLMNVALQLHPNSNSNNDKVQPIESLLVDATSKLLAMVVRASITKRPIRNGGPLYHKATKASARSLTTIARSSTTQHVGTNRMGAKTAKSASFLTVTEKAFW